MIGINSTTHTLGRVGVYWGKVETRCVWNLLCSYLDKELIDELMFDFHVSQALQGLRFHVKQINFKLLSLIVMWNCIKSLIVMWNSIF